MLRATSIILGVALLVGCATRGGPAPASVEAPGEVAWASVSATSWEDLQRRLVGRWKATREDGSTITVTYRVVSRGSAMIETFVTASGTETVSMYHPDGDHLMLTHYCAQGNQARLKAVEVAPSRAVFRFLDATNVGPEQGVMRELEVRVGADGFEQRSVYRSPDGADGADVLHFVREPG